MSARLSLQSNPKMTKLEGPMSVDAAISSFEKKFKSKTGHKWAGNLGDYPGKNKKYTVLHEKHGGGGSQAAAVAAASPAKVAVKRAPAKVKGKLAASTKVVTDQDMFKSQLKNLNIDTEKMPLGDISEQTIEKGFSALHGHGSK